MADNVQDVVDQVDKEPVQPAAPATASTAQADPDDAEVAAALAAAESEAKGVAQPVAAAAPAAPAAPAAEPQKPAGTPPAPASEQPMIPKARLDEVLAQSAAKDQTIARLQGETEALKMVVQPKAPGATPAQPAAPSLEQEVASLRQQQDALAKRYDDGEVDMATVTREIRKLEDQVFRLREQSLAEKLKPAPAAPQATAPDMRLEEKFQELEGAHPMLKTAEVMRDDHWDFLLNEAATQLRNEGVEFPKGPLPPLLRFKLSERVATLSDVYGPIWGAKAAQPQQQPAPPNKGMSPTAQARANKLDLAANAPPDVNRLTPQGGQGPEFTEDQIANMSDEEILALPKSVRERFSTA